MAKVNKTKHSGFWIRGMALGVDVILIVVPIYFAYQLILRYLLFEVNITRYQLNQVELVYTIALMVLWSLIISAFTQSKWQASPGKKLLGLKVIKTNSKSHLTFRNALLRTTAPLLCTIPYLILKAGKVFAFINAILKNDIIYISLVTIGAVSIILWFLSAVLTKDKTTIHDFICKTRVIYCAYISKKRFWLIATIVVIFYSSLIVQNIFYTYMRHQEVQNKNQIIYKRQDLNE